MLGLAVALASPGVKVVEGGEKPETAFAIFGAIIVATVVFLAIITLFSDFINIVILGLEVLALFSSSYILFYLISPYSALPGAVTAVLARILFPQTKNLSVAIIGGVSAALFGLSLSPIVSLLLYIIMVLYDFLSVFITGHMIKLAKGIDRTIGRGEGVALGAGDLVIPLIFATSYFPVSPAVSVVSAVATVLGVAFTFRALRTFRRPLPALPYIAAIQLPVTALSLFLTSFLL